MSAWTSSSRLCGSPLQHQPEGLSSSPTSSLGSDVSDLSNESWSSQASAASSATSASSSSSRWRSTHDGSQSSQTSRARTDAATTARPFTQAAYRKKGLTVSPRTEDAWPACLAAKRSLAVERGCPNPRRTGFCPSRVKPSLVRQNDRREDFVEYLVDTATQMVAVIWPNSLAPLAPGSTDPKNQILPLRMFIKETLRRSRTSYSTLQVAMYYLILIKSKANLPRCDFTMEQLEDSPSFRAMQCGRRMFLAALILASKYLQDRNYSARAWSKISGLKVHEINTNELAFLAAVDWKLHIPEEIFLRWTDIVTTYTNSLNSWAPRAGLCSAISNSWTSLIKRLTPALDFAQTTWTRPGQANRPAPDSDIKRDSPVEPTFELHGPPESAVRTPAEHITGSPMTQIHVAPPTPLLNSHLTTPQTTPGSVLSVTPSVSSLGSAKMSHLSLRHMSSHHQLKPSPEEFELRMRLYRSNSSATVNSQPESGVIPRSTPQTPILGPLNWTETSSPAADTVKPNSERKCAVKALYDSFTRGQAQFSCKRTQSILQVVSSARAAPDAGIASLLEAAKELDFSMNSSRDITPQPSDASYQVSTGGLPTPSTSHGSPYSNASVSGELAPVSSTTSAPSDTPCRQKKRARSSFDLSSLQYQVRETLLGAKPTTGQPEVLEDELQASSFTLLSRVRSCPEPNNQAKALQKPMHMGPERVPVEKELGRKRACCTSARTFG